MSWDAQQLNRGGKHILLEREETVTPRWDLRSSRLGAPKNVTISHLGVSDEEQRTEKLTRIVSEGVYAYLKQAGSVRKESALRSPEN
jgi:hypothetical protein